MDKILEQKFINEHCRNCKFDKVQTEICHITRTLSGDYYCKGEQPIIQENK